MIPQVILTPDIGTACTVKLNSNSPVLTDGFGGWETIDRPKRVGLTRFKGKNPFTQDIAFILDGWIDEVSQESAIESLIQLSQPVSNLQEPPKIKLSGHALRKNLTWVIQGIDWDADTAIWGFLGTTSVRFRQTGTIHLLEYVSDNVIVTASSPALQGKTGGKRKTVSGVTMKQLAQLEYGNPDAYFEIFMANLWLNPDPRAIIPDGTPVFIPQYNGHSAKTVTVGTGNIP